MRARWIGWLLLGYAAASAKVVVQPTEWTLTTKVQPGAKAQATFVVANQGDAAVTILRCSGSRFLNLTLERARLAPGQRATLTATYVSEIGETGPSEYKGDIVLFLDSAQDKVTLPVRIARQTGLGPRTATRTLPPYQPRPGDHPVVAKFYFDSGCGKCELFVRSLILPIKNAYQNSAATIELHDLKVKGEIDQFNALKEQYNVTEPASTHVFCGSHALVGNDDIQDHLADVLRAELRHPTEPPPRVVSGGEIAGPAASLGRDATLRVFQRLTLLGLTLTGVVDGFNPCAIATAIFLIVMLTRLGHDRRSLLLAGAAYTAAVYATYFLVGYGLLHTLSWFGSHAVLSRALNTVIAAAAFLFAGLQVADVLKLRRGAAPREMLLQLPSRLKQIAHGVLRENLSRPLIAVGSVIAGVAVTLLEAVCTGQTYIPVLQAVLATPGLKTRAVAFLALYNLGFIAPMVLILVLTYRGMASETMAAAARRHLIPAKLALAGMLLLLGCYLLVGTPH